MTTTDTQVKDWEKEFVEEAADLEHERWARWQHYLHSKCTINKDGSLTIPAELVDRWKRQIVITYAELSESEKESDRKEARTYVPLIDKILKADRAYLAGEVGKLMHLNTQNKPADEIEEVDERAYTAACRQLLAIINQ